MPQYPFLAIAAPQAYFVGSIAVGAALLIRPSWGDRSILAGALMFQRVLYLLLASSLGGCAISGGYPQAPVSVDTDLEPLKAYFATDILSQYAQTADLDAKRALRNEIIYGRIAAYDVEFSQFQIDIGRSRAIGDATADSIIAATSAAATGFSAKATKTALSGVTTAVTGIKGAYDKDLFFDQAMASLFSYMSSNRAKILATIDKSTTLSVVDYPLTRGLIDASNYRDAGSIPGALAAIAENTGPQKQSAATALASAQGLKLRLRNVR